MAVKQKIKSFKISNYAYLQRQTAEKPFTNHLNCGRISGNGFHLLF